MAEKQRVRVMWADHDRAAAHNLDDLRERWFLKRGEMGDSHLGEEAFDRYRKIPKELAQLPPLAEFDEELATQDFTAFESIEIAEAWRSRLGTYRHVLQSWLSDLKAYLATNRLHTPEYQELIVKRNAKSQELFFIEAAQGAVKECIRDLRNKLRPSQTREQRRSLEIEELLQLAEASGDPDKALIGKAFELLVRLVKDGRVKYTPEEKTVINALRLYLQDLGEVTEEDADFTDNPRPDQ